MKYIVQLDFKIYNFTTDDGDIVDGVIVTFKMDCEPESFLLELHARSLDMLTDLKNRSELIEVKAFAVESYEGVEEGNIYY